MREGIDKEFAVREMLKQRAAPLADHPHLMPSLGLLLRGAPARAQGQRPGARDAGDGPRARQVRGAPAGRRHV